LDLRPLVQPTFHIVLPRLDLHLGAIHVKHAPSLRCLALRQRSHCRHRLTGVL
jgi:hypothetical protein